MLKNQDNKKVYLILLLPHSTNWDEITIDLKACGLTCGYAWLNEKLFCTQDFCLHWTELFIKLKKYIDITVPYKMPYPIISSDHIALAI